MVDEREIVVFLCGTGVLLFVLVKLSQLQRLPAGTILLAGFCSFWAGWGFTIIEVFFWGKLFNYLEHISYAVGALLFAIWSVVVFGKKARSS